MQHVVTREPHGDGTTTLRVLGYDYCPGSLTGLEELAAVQVQQPVLTDGTALIETSAAVALVRRTISPRHTVVWVGQAWQVECSGALWQTTA